MHGLLILGIKHVFSFLASLKMIEQAQFLFHVQQLILGSLEKVAEKIAL